MRDIGTGKIKSVERDVVEILDGKKTVSFEQWMKIDRVEIERGKEKGKVREKIKSIEEMMEVAFN